MFLLFSYKLQTSRMTERNHIKRHTNHWQFLFLNGWNFIKYYQWTTRPNDIYVGTNNVCLVFCKVSSFHLDPAKYGWIFQKIISETTVLNDLLHSTNDICEVLHNHSSFCLPYCYYRSSSCSSGSELFLKEALPQQYDKV